jgi:predicted NodU family carbamoyl transferase
MMKRLLVLSFVVLALLPSMQQLFAWGAKGHRIIAQVAYNNLNNKTRKQVDAVLGKHGMIYLAAWADEIKSDTIYPQSHDWHYQDLDGGLTDSAVVSKLRDYPVEGGNMFRALDSLKNELKVHKDNHDALAFYVHLYADRFCPMHVAHLDDKGGNAVKMKWFGQNTNLHSVWDAKIIDSKGFTYSEYAIYLQDKFGAKKKEVLKMTAEETLLCTYHLTDNIYRYHTTWNGNAYHYSYYWIGPMEWQMYIGAIKLAQNLNEIYK